MAYSASDFVEAMTGLFPRAAAILDDTPDGQSNLETFADAISEEVRSLRQDMLTLAVDVTVITARVNMASQLPSVRAALQRPPIDPASTGGA